MEELSDPCLHDFSYLKWVEHLFKMWSLSHHFSVILLLALYVNINATINRATLVGKYVC